MKAQRWVWLTAATLVVAGLVAKVADLTMREQVRFGRPRLTVEDAVVLVILAVLMGLVIANAWRFRD